MSQDSNVRPEAAAAASWWRALLAEVPTDPEQDDVFEAALALLITRQMERDESNGLATIIGIPQVPVPALFQALTEAGILAYPLAARDHHTVIMPGMVYVIKPDDSREQIYPTDQ